MCRVMYREIYIELHFPWEDFTYRESTRKYMFHVIVGSLRGDRKFVP